jgi:hypothetical protein
MDTSALISGGTYYRITFADPALTMPGLEPLVYIGLHDSDGTLLHTFQDTISYTWVGRYPGPFRSNQDMEISLYPMQEKEAAAMLSLAEVVEKVGELFARAQRLGFPTLLAARVTSSDAV